MKIQNRENTLSSTGRLDKVERAEVFGREYLDTAILFQVQHHIIDTERLAGFLLLFMLCLLLSFLSLWSVKILATKRVLHHWCKLGLFPCNNKLYQGWAVLTRRITVSPCGLLPIRVQGSWNAKLGPDYFMVAGTQLSAMCVTMVHLLFLSAELLPWEMHTCVLGQNLEFSLILCFLNTSGIYYVAG